MRTLFLWAICAFQCSRQAAGFVGSAPLQRRGASRLLAATTRKTLTEETTWRLRFLLKGIPTSAGKKIDELFVVEANFVEEEGYEPPQGFLKQTTQEGARQLEIVNSRWLLSEDPDDRRDGLWVWGLFKEPLYPFMLLQLETRPIPLPGSGEDEKEFVKPLQLYAQINHSRDKETGVALSSATLNVRQMETVKADLLGVASVDVYEEVSVGQLSIQPVS